MAGGRLICAFALHSTLPPKSQNPLNPSFPAHTSYSDVSPLFPIHKKIIGGGGTQRVLPAMTASASPSTVRFCIFLHLPYTSHHYPQYLQQLPHSVPKKVGEGVHESVCQPVFCVRARLQPCRNQRRINAALARGAVSGVFTQTRTPYTCPISELWSAAARLHFRPIYESPGHGSRVTCCLLPTVGYLSPVTSHFLPTATARDLCRVSTLSTQNDVRPHH